VTFSDFGDILDVVRAYEKLKNPKLISPFSDLWLQRYPKFSALS
jgi:hypothetical protein